MQTPGHDPAMRPGQSTPSTIAPASHAHPAYRPPAQPGDRAWGLIALVLLVPLPLASVDPWSRAAVILTAGVLLFMAVRSGTFEGLDPRLRRWLVGTVMLAAIVLAWAGLQTLPQVADILSVNVRDFGPALAQASGRPSAVAVNPDGARDHILMSASLVVIFALAIGSCRDPGAARQLLAAVSIAAAIYGGYGLVIHFAGIERVLWLNKEAYRGWVTGPFINRNSFAAYLGLGLVTVTGFIMDRLGRVGRGRTGWLRALVALEEIGFAGWLLLAAFVTISAALLLTGSRAGTAATGMGLLVLLIAQTRGDRRGRYTAGLLVLVGAVLASLHFGNAVGLRLVDTITDDGFGNRAKIYAVATDLILERPLVGFGFGGFPDVFGQARGVDLVGLEVVVRKAHSAYLELPVELGVPAALAVFGGIAAVVLRCFAGALERRRRRVYPAIATGASALVASHALVDFSLQIPAVAVTYAALLGVGLAHSFSTRSGSAFSPVKTPHESGGRAASSERHTGQPVEGPPA